jgi:hypothetical protein
MSKLEGEGVHSRMTYRHHAVAYFPHDPQTAETEVGSLDDMNLDPQVPPWAGSVDERGCPVLMAVVAREDLGLGDL